MNAQDIIKLLNLQPHPEGGFFKETYRSNEFIDSSALPKRYVGNRVVSTCIYYLLTPDSYSAMHRVKSDELFHFYLGDTVEMLQLLPQGTSKVIKLGSNLLDGEHLQVPVPQNTWQGCRLVSGGQFALMGATVAPGFEYQDFELATQAELVGLYPDHSELLKQLTRS